MPLALRLALPRCGDAVRIVFDETQSPAGLQDGCEFERVLVVVCMSDCIGRQGLSNAHGRMQVHQGVGE
jgi:hypothetical protein